MSATSKTIFHTFQTASYSHISYSHTFHTFVPQGSLHVDAEYCRLSKDRNIKAAVRTRVVRQFEDNRSNHLSVLASKRMAEMDAKRKVWEVTHYQFITHSMSVSWLFGSESAAGTQQNLGARVFTGMACMCDGHWACHRLVLANLQNPSMDPW